MTFKKYLNLSKWKKTKERSGNPLVNVLKEEWKYLGDRRKQYVLYVILFSIAGLISLTTPLVIGLIFNSIQENITSEQELNNLIYLIFLLLAIDVGFWIFHGAGRILEERTGFFVHRNFVMDKINKVLSLPTKWHKDHHSGDTIDRINRAGDSIFSFSQFMASNVVYAVLNIVGSLIVLFFS